MLLFCVGAMLPLDLLVTMKNKVMGSVKIIEYDLLVLNLFVSINIYK